MQKPVRRRFKALGATAVLGAALLVPAASSSAANLAGPWAPYGRCPVDSPVMLGQEGFGKVGCIASDSSHGTFKIGDTVVKTGRVDAQFGGISGDDGIDVVPPGTLVAQPVKVPGGLLGIMTPEALKPLLDPVLDPVLGVKATVELAGPISDFNALGALTEGTPVATIPVKIHLTNLLLGSKCYIGSDKDPIVLHPANTAAPDLSGLQVVPDPYGTDTVLLSIPGGTQADDSFAVPKANGCGLLGLGLLDSAIDSKLGLPSPAGANKLVMEGVTSSVAGSGGTTTAEQFAASWHAADADAAG